MTIELTHAAASAVSWVSPDRGLWVASDGGDYLGMIEQRGGRYISTDARSRTVGTFDDFTAAQSALDHDNLGVDLDRRERLTTRITIGLAIVSAAGIAYAFGFLLT